jgi:hypothetical protein
VVDHRRVDEVVEELDLEERVVVRERGTRPLSGYCFFGASSVT